MNVFGGVHHHLTCDRIPTHQPLHLVRHLHLHQLHLGLTTLIPIEFDLVASMTNSVLLEMESSALQQIITA